MSLTKLFAQRLAKSHFIERVSILVFCLVSLAVLQLAHGAERPEVNPEEEDFLAVEKSFQENCAVCHGSEMEGAAQGVALVGRELTHGDSVDALINSIRDGFPKKGMPAWGKVMAETDLQAFAIHIKERRSGWVNGEFYVADPMQIPTGAVKSEKQAFVVEILSDNIDSLPYAMDYLPDGQILVTEKYYGLATIDRTGKKTYIKNTPKLSANSKMFSELDKGSGWMLDVAVHPEYKKNGWVYLTYGDTCGDCERGMPEIPLKPTMTRLVRGRIKDNKWVDQEDIWRAKKNLYTQESDIVAGGIIVFDNQKHVFMTVGVKGGYIEGVQDINTPYGKVLRLYDDGRIPEDNPYVDVPGAEMAVWAYGFRNPEGLFYDKHTQKLWASDNGPRGGDEINLIRPDVNYGWPLYSPWC